MRTRSNHISSLFKLSTIPSWAAAWKHLQTAKQQDGQCRLPTCRYVAKNSLDATPKSPMQLAQQDHGTRTNFTPGGQPSENPSVCRWHSTRPQHPNHGLAQIGPQDLLSKAAVVPTPRRARRMWGISCEPERASRSEKRVSQHLWP